MTLSLPRNVYCCRGLLYLLVTGCLAIAQVEGCDNCLFGSLYCHQDTQQCMYGCQPGWKGPSCSDRCGINRCRECVIGDGGAERCTSCSYGSYGPQCNTSCSPHCLRPSGNDVCDQYGHCHFGCMKPYMGARCEDQDCPYANCKSCKSSFNDYVYCYICTEGYYWTHELAKCTPCSEHCFNGSKDCDGQTGTCSGMRCQDGWFGDRCDRFCDIQNCTMCTVNGKQNICMQCKLGQYPSGDGRKCVNCEEQHCRDTCDKRTGGCNYGCLPGYYGSGLRCDRSCDINNCEKCTVGSRDRPVCAKCNEGFYVDGDLRCEKCSRNCRNGKCDSYSGTCTEGCNEGFYGNRCQYTCGEHCLNNTCSENTGTCVCEEGWYGDRCVRNCPVHCLSCDEFKDSECKECEAGFWGKECDLHCNANCRHSGFSNYLYCDQRTGYCPNGCYDGFYGSSCNLTCSTKCGANVCDMQTGNCILGCSSVSWYGEKCDMRCPANCVDVTVGWSRTCSQTTGSCKHGCKAGFYGEHCNKTCSYRCKDRKCIEGTGECLEGCAEGFSGPHCSYICTKDCASECSPNCLQESCDQESKACVDGCIQGWYGINCQEICSDNCMERKCHQLTGACLEACLSGYYGAACSLQCNKNCLENDCNKQTGYCTYGCKADFHGPDCAISCSSNCPSGTCDRDTGACTQCGTGRHGPFCEQDCLPGHYGENCKESCGHCKDYSPCYVMDGRCPSGCEAGWTGPGCQQALAQFSAETENSPSRGVQIAIGCSVGSVFCALIFAAVLWFKKKKSWKKRKSEPVVVYSDARVNIESVHQPCTSVQIVQSQGETCSQDSTVSIQSQSAMLLGDPDTGSQIRVLQLLDQGEFSALYKGSLTICNQQEECCVKYVQLTELADRSTHLKRLMKESEILSTCGSHINIINLIKTYLNTDVYCIALNNSVQTGLLPYLHRLQTGSTDDNISSTEAFQILHFTIDCCSAVRHLHDLKILHKALQARHMYLSDTLVAKLGNFEWAEMVAMETEEASEEAVEMDPLPEVFYPWLAPESFLKNNFSYSSDIWSLGVLFWEIFTLGKTPFEGLDRDSHQQAVMDGIRPSKPSLAHFTLYRVMKSCWRYDVEDRPRADNLLQQLIDIQGRYANVESIVVQV